MMEITTKIFINKKTQISFFVIILLLAECYFFRNILFVDSNGLIGDGMDGRLTNLLTEHWYRWLCGKEKITELLMFYPAKEVIGYTDLLLAFGIPHSLLRMVGFDIFNSYKYSMILIHLLGTFSMFYLLKHKLNINSWCSLLGTIIFCFSDTFQRSIVHTQLNAISMLPLLLIIFIDFYNANNKNKRMIYGVLFITWFALLSYTSWYVACFAGIFVFIFGIVYIIDVVIKRSSFKENIKVFYEIKPKEYLLYITYLIIVFIPYVMIYYPCFQSSNGYPYIDILIYMPEPIDLINVTKNNLMFGKIIDVFDLTNRNVSGEVEIGFSIIVLFMFVVFFVKEFSFETHNKKSSILKIAYISIIFCILFSVKLSSNGISLWLVLIKIFPFLKSIRAVARFILWLSFPISIVISYSLNNCKIMKRTNNLVVIICVLTFVSNINLTGVVSLWNRNREMDFVKNVTQPPSKIDAFFICDSLAENNNDPNESVSYQLDAYEIATFYNVKTINGYSGGFPKNWEGIFNPLSDEYYDSVLLWKDKKRIDKLYSYDLATNKWKLE